MIVFGEMARDGLRCGVTRILDELEVKNEARWKKEQEKAAPEAEAAKVTSAALVEDAPQEEAVPEAEATEVASEALVEDAPQEEAAPEAEAAAKESSKQGG